MVPVNFISDTVTKPSSEMLKYMMNAEVGDDVFRADPTVNRLESIMAEMFGKEEALFCPSGTMTNQIAIQVHLRRLEELICEKKSHVYQYETGGFAYNANAAVSLIETGNGKLTLQDIKSAIKPYYDWLPKSRLVVIENSCNAAGGIYYTLDEVEPISSFCRSNDLKIHLDGARLFNVLVETKETTEQWGSQFDTLSICLSKGLGAPVGSVLIGSQEDLIIARRLRKAMGGGMRQAGYLAAAGLFALENNIDQLALDNRHAHQIADVIKTKNYVKELRPVYTNIVIFTLSDDWETDDFLAMLQRKNILAVALGPKTIRFVTHRDISNEMMSYALEQLESID